MTTMLLAEGNGSANPNAKQSAKEVYDSNYSDTWIAKFEELVPQQEIRWIIVGAGILILLAIAAWIVMKLKGYTDYDGGSINHLTEFEDLHERGAFSEEEMAKMRDSIRSNVNPLPAEKDTANSEASETQADDDSAEDRVEINKPR